MVYEASAAPSSVMVAGTGGAPAGKAVERKGRRAVRAMRDVRECIVVGWVGWCWLGSECCGFWLLVVGLLCCEVLMEVMEVMVMSAD